MRLLFRQRQNGEIGKRAEDQEESREGGGGVRAGEEGQRGLGDVHCFSEHEDEVLVGDGGRGGEEEIGEGEECGGVHADEC